MVAIFIYIASGLTGRLTVRSEDGGQDTSRGCSVCFLAGVLVRA